MRRAGPQEGRIGGPAAGAAVGLSVGASVLLLAGCGGGAERAARADTVRSAAVADILVAETATVAVPLTLPGQLYTEHDAWVHARTSGIVESLAVDLGESVRAGELLAQLESTDQRIAVAQAELAHDNARRDVARQRSLAETRLVAAADSERAEAAFRASELALQQARRNLELARVTAPFAGVVAARVVRTGRLVVPGDTLFRITALAPLRVAVHAPEAAGRAFAVGAGATVVAAEGRAARAVVIRAAPSVDAASGTRTLVLELAPGSGLVPGAAVTVRIGGGGERRRVVVVPAAAVTDSGYVLVWQDGRTTLRPVTLGAALPDGRVEVVSGIGPGERLARPAARP